MSSRGTLTEQDQQCGGWLSGPPIIAKKCSVVRVDGFGVADKDQVERQAWMNVEEPMDIFEVQVCGNSRGSRVEGEPNRVNQGELRTIAQASEEFFEPIQTSLENSKGRVVLSNEQFQDRLKEIDKELAKFDSSECRDPSLTHSEEQQTTPIRVDRQLVKDSEEEFVASRGLTRGWKRLLRLREASTTDPSLGQSKQKVQEV